MKAITFKRSNFSGMLDTVTIKNNSFVTDVFEGTFEEVEEDFVKVTIKGYEHAPLYSLLVNNEWECDRSLITKYSENPVVAALQVAHNLF